MKPEDNRQINQRHVVRFGQLQMHTILTTDDVINSESRLLQTGFDKQSDFLVVFYE